MGRATCYILGLIAGLSPPSLRFVGLRGDLTICGGFRLLRAETATNGAIGPPGGANRRWVVAPVGLGGGANRRWVVAPVGLGGGANRCCVVAPVGYGWRQSVGGAGLQ